MEFYNEILAVVKDENIAKGVVQSMYLTGCQWQEIVKSMGFDI